MKPINKILFQRKSKVNICSTLGIPILLSLASILYVPTTLAVQFEFAVVGDTGYTQSHLQNFEDMFSLQLNSESLAFVAHVGDTKGGQTCDASNRSAVKAVFQSSTNAVVYTPGDNEWTDCASPFLVKSLGASPVAPLEALAAIRQDFFISLGHNSLGVNPIMLTRQSDTGDDPGTSFDESLYVENQAWQIGDIHFVTLHIPGSQDNCIQYDPGNNSQLKKIGSSTKCSPEKVNREAANLAWLDKVLADADAANAKGMVIFLHANMSYGDRSVENPFRSYVNALEAAAKARPDVEFLQFYGDSHTQRSYQPFLSDIRLTEIPVRFVLDNYTAVETYGFPDTGWTRVTVDTSKDNPFNIQKGGVCNNCGL